MRGKPGIGSASCARTCSGKAPRRRGALWPAIARGAWLALALVAGGAAAQERLGACDVTAGALVAASYGEPTTRYAHAVLGDAIEFGALSFDYGDGGQCLLRLPQERVFEDLAPRLADVDGDGAPEAVVIESHRDFGARLAVYTGAGLLAATPYIGRSNRWLAPVAIADLDGDGAIEIAYVDRPHLAKTLRVWRFTDGRLVEMAAARGLSNHRIGWAYIEGGLRDCGRGPEMVLASGDWRQVLSLTFDGQSLSATPLGRYSPAAIAAALACE